MVLAEYEAVHNCIQAERHREGKLAGYSGGRSTRAVAIHFSRGPIGEGGDATIGLPGAVDEVPKMAFIGVGVR